MDQNVINSLIYSILHNLFIISVILVLYMENIDIPIAVGISVGVGLVIGIAVQLFLVPWQRGKITGNHRSDRVKFTINDSSESTPCGSPKRNRRPTSLVQSESKTLPAITEQTELASFNNLSGLNPCLYANDKSQQNGVKTPSLANGNYKIDPKIIEKAEHLLGQHRSLDNTDLTITSLNFIDEHHQPNGYLHATSQPKQTLQNYFDNHLNHQPTPKRK